jgi:gliding motility-associated-like protein
LNISIFAQCNIVVNGVTCVGNPIEFEVKSPGSSNHLWNFNNEGQNNTTSNPTFTFYSLGTKTITYSCLLADGKTCSATINVVIHDTPHVRLRLLSPPVQCFENNQFCFKDSSLSGNNDGCIKSIKYLFSDGELITKYGSKNNPVQLPDVICKSYTDPQGNEYTLTVEIEDCNGCITKSVYPVKMKVELLPAIFASQSVIADRCHGKANVSFYNKSQIKKSDVVKFYWIFDDGSIDSTSWDSVAHTYNIGGKMTQIFAPKLVIVTGIGCTRTFNLDEVIVYNFEPKIIHDKDSICFGETINFEIIPKELEEYIKPEKVRWNFNPGTNFGYKTFNSYSFIGPSLVSANLSHVCGPYLIYDTVVVIGPKPIIEPDYIDMNERYQCTVKDSVHVVDRSEYYHNDTNIMNDDSMYVELPENLKFVFKFDPQKGRYVSEKPFDYDRDKDNVERIWDFDDPYCLPCTTDRAKNKNVGLNCRYSTDSIDVHGYTDWDSVYNYLYVKKPISLAFFDRVNGKCDKKYIWFEDSLYAVVDTLLYYGKNPLGNSAKDSSVFKTLKHLQELPSGLFGFGSYKFPLDLNVYIPAGNQIKVTAVNSSPLFINGPQYYTVNSNVLIETNSNDSVYFVYGYRVFKDTLTASNIRPWHRIQGKVPPAGYQNGDSINPILHRRLFYENYPRCFKITLNLRDTVHPFKCDTRVGANVAMLPPSAKRLLATDHYCYGYGNKVVEFELSDTKPGCLTSTVYFNPDTKADPNNWLLLNNLYYGDMKRNVFLNSQPPYSGYANSGPNHGKFFWAYNDTALENKNIQSINVGLIIGNGVAPETCSDTIYYNHFATFPRLSSKLEFAENNDRKLHACRNNNVWVTIPNDEPDANLLADKSGWYMIDNKSGDTMAMIEENYFKVVDHKDYPGQKVNFTVINRFNYIGQTQILVKKDTIVTGIVHDYKAVALPGAGFNKLREEIASMGLDIVDFPDTVVLELIWNGIGTIGMPNTGSRGCVDTTGFGHELNWYYKINSVTTLNYKDSSMYPADSVKLSNGVTKKAYAFHPKYNSSYSIYRFVESYFPTYCPRESSINLAVGFNSEIEISDSIICQGRTISVLPKFRYYDVDTQFYSLDTMDYWFTRKADAGKDNREGLTIWDLSKEDDDVSNPPTIFGAFPYAKIGYGQPGFVIGNEPSAIYYKKPGIYTMRVAGADSNDCKDTFTQRLYVTGPKAGFYTDVVAPNCKTILELFDTSKIIDPCELEGLPPCDFIYKWTIRWGDGTAPLTYFKQLPKQIGHDYAQNGYYKITLVIESILGCVDSMSQFIFIPGPSPLFVPETPLVICVNDSVTFRNITQNFTESSQWLWNFGDGFYNPQFDSGQISHKYTVPGLYDVYLNQFDSIANSGKYCPAIYPDVKGGQKKITVRVLPYDTVNLFADPIVVCVGDTLTVSANLKTQVNYLSYNWDIEGDVQNTSENNLKFVPKKSGAYQIRWSADTIGLNSNTCPDYDTITVFADSIYADFVIDDSKKPIFCFTNRSKWAASYRWGFFHDSDITVNRLEFKHNENQFPPDSVICQNFIERYGVSWVCLEAKNALGCMDTVCKKINNDFEMGILPPNVFTPNDDGFMGVDKEGLPGNNVFNIYTKNVIEYHLVIYDRWGVKVFESDDQNYDWNGRVNNTGKLCPDGNYYYILLYRYNGRDKDEPVLNGTVQIIR